LILAALAAACSLVALSTCSNPIDFNAEVEDQVKLANDKYLEVVSVTPAKGDAAADPSNPLVMEFDRAIDTAEIPSAAISIAPTAGGAAVEWTWSFNATTNELSITPAALEALTSYTITIAPVAGLAGSDGSLMREPYSWSFTTKNLPGGNLKINSGAAYTTSTAVTLTITKNSLAYNIRFSNSVFAADNESVGWEGSVPSSKGWTLTNGDGAKTVYYQFASATDDRSAVLHADIIFDTTPPNNPVITTSSTDVPTWVSGGNDGAGYYEFYADSGTHHTGSYTSYTYLLATGSHTVYVRERDAAGNYSGYASATFTATISPLSGSTGIGLSPTLYWPTDSYTLSLYRGTMNYRTKVITWVLVASGITTDSYTLSGLSKGTVYYWKCTYFFTKYEMTKYGPFSFMTSGLILLP